MPNISEDILMLNPYVLSIQNSNFNSPRLPVFYQAILDERSLTVSIQVSLPMQRAGWKVQERGGTWILRGKCR